MNGYTTFHTGKWHNDRESFTRSFTAADKIFFGGMSDHFKVPLRRFDPTGAYPDEEIYYEEKTHSSDLFSGAAGSVRWFEFPAASAPGDAAAPPGWSRAPVYDAADLLRRVAGDADIAAIALESFLDDIPRTLARCAAAIADADVEAQRLGCHALKGAALNVGAKMLAGVAGASAMTGYPPEVPQRTNWTSPWAAVVAPPVEDRLHAAGHSL